MAVSAEEIKSRAYEIREQITADRRCLHRIPEIGTDLPRTSGYVKKRLEEMGIGWQDCGGPLPEKMTRDFYSWQKLHQNGKTPQKVIFRTLLLKNYWKQALTDIIRIGQI